MKYIFLLLYSFSCSVAFTQDTFTGTVIIAKKIGNEIYVGADSRITDISGRSKGLMCKIIQTKFINMAVAGAFINYADSLARIVSDTAKTVDAFIRGFSDLYLRFAANGLEKKRQDDPVFYSNFIKKFKGYISETIFFGKNNGRPFLISIRNIIISEPLKRVEAKNEPHVSGDLRDAGYVREIHDSLTKKSYWKDGPISTINKAMMFAESKHSSEVGGGINIVVFRKGHIEWLQKSESCK